MLSRNEMEIFKGDLDKNKKIKRIIVSFVQLKRKMDKSQKKNLFKII